MAHSFRSPQSNVTVSLEGEAETSGTRLANDKQAAALSAFTENEPVFAGQVYLGVGDTVELNWIILRGDEDPEVVMLQDGTLPYY